MGALQVRGENFAPGSQARVGATLAVAPDPAMHGGEGCREGSPYAVVTKSGLRNNME